MNALISEPKLASSEIRKTYPVLEMTCAACAVSVESMLRNTPGVSQASVNYANQSASVQFDSAVVTPAGLQTALRSVGYDIVIESDEVGHSPQQIQQEAQQHHYDALKKRTIWASVLSVPIVLIGMFFMNMPYANYAMMILAAPVVFGLGRSYFVSAWKKARHGQTNMDTLVALSTGIAFIFSAFNTINPDFWTRRHQHPTDGGPHVYFETAAVIIAFISLGKLLEERAKSNTSSAIKKLMSLQPDTVRIVDGETERDIPTASVRVGDVLVVRPGERIPVDGSVVLGESFVDESMISGEPVPVGKTAGAPVFAGTINQKGSFRFRADTVGVDTVLARIIRTVQEAQGSKAPVQLLVDKIAGIFVPVVLGIAVLTFAGWMLFGQFAGAGDNPLTIALLTSVTVLVIACPCALGLATPTAIMVAVGKGAENNILVKDAESLELGHKVTAVVLDKTGTLTEGRPVVTDLHWFVPADEQARLAPVLYALEAQSEHPLAEAVTKHLQLTGVLGVSMSAFQSLTGQGVRARYEQVSYFVGNNQLIDSEGITLSETARKQADLLRGQAKTVVFFANDKQVLALIALADPIKATSRQAVGRLQRQGITVYMLTGDNAQTAAAVAQQVGIRDYRAETLPSDKADFVKTLQQRGSVVAMVGDGINDAQALAQADVSIAMGKGSDVAMDVAQLTLITADLNSIPSALELSRKTVQTIRQNLFWAFIYNLIGIPIAAGLLYPAFGFLLNPMIAGAAMALSSVSVVSNSLRLRLLKLA